jgi:glutamine amidotransferase
MKKVAIVDYGLCNLDSISRAVQECGGDPVVTDGPQELRNAAYIILPGVGAFPDAMRNMWDRSLPETLYEQVMVRQVPFLGICLGMQLLAKKSYEVKETPGLGWVDAEVRRLRPSAGGERIPHIGWNEVVLVRECPLFRGIPSEKDFYFVHSYHLCLDAEAPVVGKTPYCGGFVSAVQHELVFGIQFHPEKSQRLGFQLLRNFLAL